MGGEDNLPASVAHLVLCCVAGRGISRIADQTGFTHVGMHANFFIHGIFGFFNSQSGLLGNDFAPIYTVTLQASKYLALPCLMADMYRSRKEIGLLHLASGVVPFAMALAGSDNPHLGNTMIACNIISLLVYSINNDRTFGYYTVAAGLFAYFVAPPTGNKALYPLGLALMEYCAYRLFYFEPIDPRGRGNRPPRPPKPPKK